MSLKYKVVPVTAFMQNCTVLWCDQTLQAVVVDPGGEVERIEAALTEAGLTLVAVWLTHGHLDHVGGAQALAQAHQVQIIGPQEEDAFWLAGMAEQCRMFGFPTVASFVPERWLGDGDTVQVGKEVLTVLHTPGHTPGHVVFHSATARLAIVGDVLFSGSIGRTDFPRGNFQQLIDSIRNKLWTLGDETEILPGHGPTSSIGRERVSNPFVGDAVI